MTRSRIHCERPVINICSSYRSSRDTDNLDLSFPIVWLSQASPSTDFSNMLLPLQTRPLFLFWLLLSLIQSVCDADKKCELDSRWPKASGKDSKEVVWRLKSGAKTVFKCSSSDKFQLVITAPSLFVDHHFTYHHFPDFHFTTFPTNDHRGGLLLTQLYH